MTLRVPPLADKTLNCTPYRYFDKVGSALPFRFGYRDPRVRIMDSRGSGSVDQCVSSRFNSRP